MHLVNMFLRLLWRLWIWAGLYLQVSNSFFRICWLSALADPPVNMYELYFTSQILYLLTISRLADRVVNIFSLPISTHLISTYLLFTSRSPTTTSLNLSTYLPLLLFLTRTSRQDSKYLSSNLSKTIGYSCSCSWGQIVVKLFTFPFLLNSEAKHETNTTHNYDIEHLFFLCANRGK